MRVFLLTLMPALLAAADPYTFAVRVSGGIQPGITDVEFEVGGVLGQTITNTADADVGFGALIQGTAAQRFNDTLGYTVGVGLFVRHHEGTDPEDSANTLSVTAFGLEAFPALTFTIAPTWWIEIGPTIAVGAGRRVLKEEGSDLPDATGFYTSFGGRLGGYTIFKEHWLVGVDVGYTAFRNTDSSDIDDTTIDTTIEGDGFTANVAVGYRF